MPTPYELSRSRGSPPLSIDRKGVLRAVLGRYPRPDHGTQPREPETAFFGLNGLPTMRTVRASAIHWARALSHRLTTPPRRSGCRGRSGKAAPGVSTCTRATSYARILTGFASPIMARLRCRRWRDRALSVGSVRVAARTVAGLIAVSGPAPPSGGGTQAPASSAPG
jgi:hypothetical protein